jgi:predicted O-methyltransferase YrrM
MKNYKFTQNWFTANDLIQFLPLQPQEETPILEIGSFEGKSTIWFIDNFLNNPKSSITCIDPWTSFNQKHNSMNSYSENLNDKQQFTNILDGFVFTDEYQTFLHNIEETTKSSQVNIIKGFSKSELPNLITESKKYDIIFIDGNHTAPYVLLDAVMSWELLNVNGYMIFDDYLWNATNLPETLTPKMAVDSFISIYSDYLEVCWSDYRVAIKKIK